MAQRQVLLLIVDDDDSMRRLLVTLFRSEGYTVLEARGGMEALAFIASSKPDLVLLDLMMPGMTGRETYIEARSLGFNGPVALLSASPNLRMVADELGCNYVAKPFVVEELLDKVASVV